MVQFYKQKLLLMLLLLLAACNASAGEVEIFSGPTIIGNWDAYAQIDASKFATAKEGDIVKVYTNGVNNDAQGSFKDGASWAAIADGLEYFEISGDFKMTITKDILDKLKTSGLIVGGKNYTIESVVLISSDTSSGTTEVTLSEEGKVITSDWSAWLTIESTALKSAKVGDKIIVYISDVADGAQGAIRDSNWGNLDETTGYFNISGDSYSYTISEEALEKLATGIIYLGGHDYTITSVVLQTPNTGEAEAEIYSGPFTIASDWSTSVQLNADLFANCKAGQTIKVYISNVAEGAQGSFKTMSAGWPAIAEGTEYFSISGDNFTLAIDEDVLAKLKTTGLVISGHDYTIESVVIVTPGAGKQTNAALFPIAKDEDVEVYDATFDATSKTITFDKYGIAGWSWNTSYNMSMYESVTIELAEKTETSITVQTSYANKASAEYVEIAAGKKKIEFPLNEDYSGAVESVYLYPTNADATSIVINTVYGTLKNGMTDGIEERIANETDSSIISHTYYNISGQQSSQLHKGLNIIRMQMSDGTIKVKKVIVK